MPRLDIHKTHRTGMAAVLGLEAYSRTHNDRGLYELIKLRTSLLNRCRYCTDLHTAALRKRGDSEERISALADWGPSALFDVRERAVLALTDQLTRLGEEGVTDQVWDAAAEHFDDKAMGNLVLAVAASNVWNRIAIAGRLDD